VAIGNGSQPSDTVTCMEPERFRTPRPHRQDPRAIKAGRAAAAAGAAALLIAGAACANTESPPPAATTGTSRPQGSNLNSATPKPTGTKTKVSAAFYPIAEAAQRVGGEAVDVTNLTPPGSGPHDLELTGAQAAELEKTNVVFYLSKGFQPAVEKASKELPPTVTRVDILTGIDLLPVGDQLEGTQGEVDGEELEGGKDPHVWVDPVLQITIATTVKDTLTKVDPGNKAVFEKNFATYKGELEALSGKFTKGLKICTSRVIVTSHRAFEYLAKRYDLRQIAIAGISPDEEPDPKTLQAVADAAKKENAKVIFFEDKLPANLAETVAREISATTDVLDPVETISEEELGKGTTYASIQEANLEALTKGLGCS